MQSKKVLAPELCWLLTQIYFSFYWKCRAIVRQFVMGQHSCCTHILNILIQYENSKASRWHFSIIKLVTISAKEKMIRGPQFNFVMINARRKYRTSFFH